MSLTRKDIKTYKSTKNQSEKYKIELKVCDDPFDRDALDGWSNPTIGIQQLKSLDRRHKSFYTKIVLISLLGIIIFSSFFIYTMNRQYSASKHSIEKKIFVEQQNSLFSRDTIKKFVELAENLQIKPKKIIEEFNQKEELRIISKAEQDDKGNDPIRMPLKKLGHLQSQHPMRRENVGKETYLHDLKVIDYRYYRSRPESPNKENLSGTPANKEDRVVDSQEDKSTLEFTYFSYLDKTLKLFRENNFKGAMNRFEIILEAYPDDVNALFYSSICLYNLNQFESCEERLILLEEGRFTNFNEEQQWYLLLTFKATARKESFEKLRSKILNDNGFYSKKAEKLSY